MTTPPVPPVEPVAPSEPEPTPPDSNRRLLIRYGAVCAALLVVLIGLTIYGFLIKERPEVRLSAPDGGELTTVTAPTTPPRSGWGDPATTRTTTPTPPSHGTDGPLSFTVHRTEIGPTIAVADPPIKKTADGVFVVVRMTVENVGTDPASFDGTFQKLRAGATTYPLADEATAYLGGTTTPLEPGGTADVAIAFDVPAGTVPEAVELHAEPDSPGVQLRLP
jgi:hypothetical protein